MGKRTPKFSIVTVCRNSESTIRQAVESVLGQRTEGGIEYIVIDGLSTDKTVKELQRYRDKLMLISESDNGIYDAMNKGIRMAKGEWVGILNSDDWYSINALELVEKAIEQFPEVEVFVGAVVRVSECKRYGKRISPHCPIESNKPNNHPATFVRKAVYQRVGGFDLRYPIAADKEFILRAQSQGVKMHPLDDVLTYMSEGGASAGIGGLCDIVKLSLRHNSLSETARYSSLMLYYKTRSLLARLFLTEEGFQEHRRRTWEMKHKTVYLNTSSAMSKEPECK